MCNVDPARARAAFSTISEMFRTADYSLYSDPDAAKVTMVSDAAAALALLPGFDSQRFMAHAASNRDEAPHLNADGTAWVWTEADGSETVAFATYPKTPAAQDSDS